MVVEDGGSPVRAPPPAVVQAAAASASSVPGAGEGEEAPHTPQVSSKHWRKIRSAVVALAAFRSRRVSVLGGGRRVVSVYVCMHVCSSTCFPTLTSVWGTAESQETRDLSVTRIFPIQSNVKSYYTQLGESVYVHRGRFCAVPSWTQHPHQTQKKKKKLVRMNGDGGGP